MTRLPPLRAHFLKIAKGRTGVFQLFRYGSVMWHRRKISDRIPYRHGRLKRWQKRIT